jgi:hypothetical protein
MRKSATKDTHSQAGRPRGLNASPPSECVARRENIAETAVRFSVANFRNIAIFVTASPKTGSEGCAAKFTGIAIAFPDRPRARTTICRWPRRFTELASSLASPGFQSTSATLAKRRFCRPGRRRRISGRGRRHWTVTRPRTRYRLCPAMGSGTEYAEIRESQSAPAPMSRRS